MTLLYAALILLLLYGTALSLGWGLVLLWMLERKRERNAGREDG